MRILTRPKDLHRKHKEDEIRKEHAANKLVCDEAATAKRWLRIRLLQLRRWLTTRLLQLIKLIRRLRLTWQVSEKKALAEADEA